MILATHSLTASINLILGSPCDFEATGASPEVFKPTRIASNWEWFGSILIRRMLAKNINFIIGEIDAAQLAPKNFYRPRGLWTRIVEFFKRLFGIYVPPPEYPTYDVPVLTPNVSLSIRGHYNGAVPEGYKAG